MKIRTRDRTRIEARFTELMTSCRKGQAQALQILVEEETERVLQDAISNIRGLPYMDQIAQRRAIEVVRQMLR